MSSYVQLELPTLENSSMRVDKISKRCHNKGMVKTLRVENFSDSSDEVVTLDVARVLTGRLLVQANSGGGKSYTLRSLLEQIRDVPQIIFDLEGEYHTLAEEFPYMVIGGDHGLFDVDTFGSIERTLVRTIENNVSIIVDLYNHNRNKRQQVVAMWLHALMHLPRPYWHPYIIVLDEAHVLAPEKGHGSSVASEEVATLVTQGRKRGLGTILATQRVSKLAKDVVAEFSSTLIGRTTLDIDVKRAADAAGFTNNTETHRKLRTLTPGQFYAVGPAFSDENTPLIMVPPVITRHPQPGEVDVILKPAERGNYAALFEDILSEPQDTGVVEEDPDATSDSLNNQTIHRYEQEIRDLKAEVARLHYELSKVTEVTSERLLEQIDSAKLTPAPLPLATHDVDLERIPKWILELLKNSPQSTTMDETMATTKLGQKSVIEGFRVLKARGLVEYGAHRTIIKTDLGSVVAKSLGAPV